MSNEGFSFRSGSGAGIVRVALSRNALSQRIRLPLFADTDYRFCVRDIRHRYDDPLASVWLGTAKKLGLSIRRSDEVFASYDGRGTLTIGAAHTLDPDDSLAQMIYHEICHSLIEGIDSFEREDWGFSLDDPQGLFREHACLRVQAVLNRRFGLSTFFAPTTDHRLFYDELGADPLRGNDESVRRARIGLGRARRSPWAPHLTNALAATRRVLEVVEGFASTSSLAATLERPLDRHPTGLFVLPDETRHCADCAFFESDASHCLKAESSTEAAAAACECFESFRDCDDCGACCREAFDLVELQPNEAFADAHRDVLVEQEGRLLLPRAADGRCPLLRGGDDAPYRCSRYEDRPQTCRDFTLFSINCLEARRKLGLSV